MADLSDNNSAMNVKIIGADSSGVEQTPVHSSSGGAIHTNLRTESGTELLGQKTMAQSIPIVFPSDQTVTTTTSPLPATGSDFSFGEITTASSASSVPVYKTTYTEQTTNGQRSFASSSANDTSAGTGARTVRVTYCDQTGAGPYSETVTLNGTSRVNTVATNICFIESMEILTVGAGGVNAGIITLFTVPTAGGSAIGTIAAGDNQTLWAHHYVPTGKTCYISGFAINNTSTAGGNGALFTIRQSSPTVANAAERQVSDSHRLFGQDSTVSRNYNSPIQVTGPAKLRVFVLPESNTSVVQRASFDYIDN